MKKNKNRKNKTENTRSFLQASHSGSLGRRIASNRDKNTFLDIERVKMCVIATNGNQMMKLKLLDIIWLLGKYLPMLKTITP